MMVGMIRDSMPFFRHTPDKLGTCLKVIAHDEEGCLHLMLCKRIENRRRIAGFISRIKCKDRSFSPRRPCIPGVVLCKILRGCIADRRFSFLLKAESPVGVRSCNSLHGVRLQAVGSNGYHGEVQTVRRLPRSYAVSG